jgi:hypothetical protein
LKRSSQLGWRDISDSWLQYRYGFRPLYYDLLDIANVINNYTEKRTRYKERAGYTIDKTFSYDIPFEYTTVEGVISHTDRLKTSYRGNVIADIIPPKIQTNIPITAWEVTRFFFIIDWFIDIGQWLAAASFLTYQSDYAAAGGYYATLDRASSITSWNSKPGWNVTACSGTAKAACSITHRTPMKVPLSLSTNIKLNTSQILDLVALAHAGAKGAGLRI